LSHVHQQVRVPAASHGGGGDVTQTAGRRLRPPHDTLISRNCGRPLRPVSLAPRTLTARSVAGGQLRLTARSLPRLLGNSTRPAH